VSAAANIVADVKPGSKHPRFTYDGERVLLAVRERAIEGAANAACIRALAQALGIAPSHIELTHGAHGRQKRFAVSGLTADQVHERLSRRTVP